jgi:hypothetical protein
MTNRGSLPNSLPKIINAISRVFREEGRSDISTMLSAAEVVVEQTSSDNWNGGTYGYTLQLQVPARTLAALRGATEQIESEILDRIKKFERMYPNEFVEAVVTSPHLQEEADGTLGTTAEELSFWTAGFLRLFLSHASSYMKETATLADELAAYGVSGFVAHEDIEPTKEWESEIRLGLATCDAVVCLLTKDFNSSNWTQQEIGFAVGRGLLVIPIRLGADPPGFIARHQGYSGMATSSQDIAKALVQILTKSTATRMKMAESLVALFETSDSYTTSIRLVKTLDWITHWTTELLERIRRAKEENSQIARVWDVPAHVDRILLAHVEK